MANGKRHRRRPIPAHRRRCRASAGGQPIPPVGMWPSENMPRPCANSRLLARRGGGRGRRRGRQGEAVVCMLDLASAIMSAAMLRQATMMNPRRNIKKESRGDSVASERRHSLAARLCRQITGDHRRIARNRLAILLLHRRVLMPASMRDRGARACLRHRGEMAVICEAGEILRKSAAARPIGRCRQL